MGQVWCVVLPCHCGPEMPQHLGYLFCAHSILKREDGAGVPEICEPDVIQPGFLDDFIVQSAHHLRRVGLLRGRVHEHQRTAGMPGMFQAQALNDFLRKELSLLSEVTILSPLSASPFILSFALLEHKGSIVSEALSQRGIYVSTRSACSSREEGYSYVVRNAGYDLRTAQNAIRLSFCGEEGIEEGEEFMRQLKEILATTNKER